MASSFLISSQDFISRPFSLAKAVTFSLSAAACAECFSVLTYELNATVCTTPPLDFIHSNCSSSKFLLWLHRALADECEAMIGALDKVIISFIDCLDG